ncbi:hypothetical protein HPB47_009420 [Ixodes persulcatus]|uniref:Uncharacterized protein n=1 Tax=Ixodes persulcatus TaxID=34615 RepID=A0AC60P296_IXOPE|nr:hypothetical protein HPB47_009420 [Ixodes persulcatus]
MQARLSALTGATRCAAPAAVAMATSGVTGPTFGATAPHPWETSTADDVDDGKLANLSSIAERKDYHHNGPSGCQFSSPGSCYRDVYGAPTNGSQDRYGGPPERDGASGGPRVANMSPQAVDDQPGKLLNLLCLYGNVVKIKFLEIKNGCPIVQIEDHLAKERALPFKPPDDTSPFKEFMGNCNNRITKLKTT